MSKLTDTLERIASTLSVIAHCCERMAHAQEPQIASSITDTPFSFWDNEDDAAYDESEIRERQIQALQDSFDEAIRMQQQEQGAMNVNRRANG